MGSNPPSAASQGRRICPSNLFPGGQIALPIRHRSARLLSGQNVPRKAPMRRAAIAVTLLVWAASASAQDYPARPIRIIVPTPAGGPVAVMARVLANALPPVLGQNVFIENKPGAGNTIGSRAAASADPDGYTLMVSAASGLIMSPMIHKNAGYDASSFA